MLLYCYPRKSQLTKGIFLQNPRIIIRVLTLHKGLLKNALSPFIILLSLFGLKFQNYYILPLLLSRFLPLHSRTRLETLVSNENLYRDILILVFHFCKAPYLTLVFIMIMTKFKKLILNLRFIQYSSLEKVEH